MGETLELPSRYQRVRFLGQGAMGVVYRAFDAIRDVEVAVKTVMAPTAELRAVLRAEFQAMTRLHHPNIARAYDWGELGETLYLALEFVRGVELHQVNQLRRKEDYAQIAALLRGLQYLHDRGFLHRDVKGSNILVAQEQVKILDLGLAEEVHRQVRGDANRTISGTPSHLAPELVDKEGATVRTDLYAVGVTLYGLATNRLPFTGDSLVELLRAIQYDEPPPIRELAPELAPGVAEVIHKLLCKDPADRYASALEVLVALNTATGCDFSLETADTIHQRIAYPALMGREDELAQIIQLWEQAQAGSGSAVVVYGEPGVGKSRMLHELRLYIQQQGGVVIEAAPGDTLRPYGVWQDLLRQLAGMSGVVVGSAWHKVATPRELEREEWFENLARLLTETLPGITMLIDDAQRLNEESRAFLRFLVPWVSDRAALLVVAGDERITDFIPVEIKRLSPGAVNTLLHTVLGTYPRRDAREIMFDLSEGNPLYIAALLRALWEQGLLQRRAAGWEVDPGSLIQTGKELDDLVGYRLEQLDDDTMTALTWAALMGEVDEPALGRLLEADTRRVRALLMRATDAQALRREGGKFVFDHVLVQRVLAKRVAANVAGDYHLRIAETLLELYGEAPLQRLATHFYCAGDGRGAGYNEQAGDRAYETFASQSALRFYSWAVELQDSVELRRKRAKVAQVLGESTLEQEDLRQQLRLTSTPTEYARTLLQLARLFLRQNEHELAGNNARAAYQICTELADQAGQAEALNIQAIQRYFRGDLERAAETFREVYRLQSVVADRDGAMRALNNLANVLRERGKLSEAQGLYEQVIAFFEEQGDLYQVHRGECNLANTLADRGLHSAALQKYLDALQLAQEVDHRESAVLLMENAAMSHQALGQYVAAWKLLAQVEERGVPEGEQAAFWAYRGAVRGALGDFDEALVDLARCMTKAEAQDILSEIYFWKGQVFLWRGNWRAAQVNFESSLYKVEGSYARYALWAKLLLGVAVWEQGQLERAGALFAESRVAAAETEMLDLYRLAHSWCSLWQVVQGKQVDGARVDVGERDSRIWFNYYCFCAAQELEDAAVGLYQAYALEHDRQGEAREAGFFAYHRRVDVRRVLGEYEWRSQLVNGLAQRSRSGVRAALLALGNLARQEQDPEQFLGKPWRMRAVEQAREVMSRW